MHLRVAGTCEDCRVRHVDAYRVRWCIWCAVGISHVSYSFKGDICRFSRVRLPTARFPAGSTLPRGVPGSCCRLIGLRKAFKLIRCDVCLAALAWIFLSRSTFSTISGSILASFLVHFRCRMALTALRMTDAECIRASMSVTSWYP